MLRLCCILVFLAPSVSAPFLLPQSPVLESKIPYNLPPDQIVVLNEQRRLAQRVLDADWKEYSSPDIASTLDEPSYLIAIARATSVQLPEAGSRLPTKYTLHVEQLLKGISDVKDLHAESMFSPPLPKDLGKPTISGGPHRTTLDLSPPRVGALYLIGYRFLYEDGMRAYIPGAIDLSDSTQARTYSEVQRFLNIESLAAGDNVKPYIAGLDDQVPWIRDLSARHLIRSNICNATSNCLDAVLSAARQLLRSKKPNERLEALETLQPLAEPISSHTQGQNGTSMMSDSAVRDIFASAVSDSNISIGDIAFGELQLYDFYLSAQPGDCIEIVPILRKAARYTSQEVRPKSFGGSFGGTFACTATQ